MSDSSVQEFSQTQNKTNKMDHQEYFRKRLIAPSDSPKIDAEFKRSVFESAKVLEKEHRKSSSQAQYFGQMPNRKELSLHPHKSLIPIYPEKDGKVNAPAFCIDASLPEDANRNFRAFPLNKSERDALSGTLSVVPSLQEFKTTFLDVFCEGQLRYLNWNNVFCAGGGVLACLQPVPVEHSATLTLKRKYFHEVQYASSDVDLFLYGLNEEEAKKKLVEIYNAVCKGCPHPVVCFRSVNAVTLVSQFPFRHIQIVLRLYSSPCDALAAFDVDACTVEFDGQQVYANIRAHHALVTRKNTIDTSRWTPSYEIRLAKYGMRGFEVELNDLQPYLVNHSKRPWDFLDGPAKLLVLENLRTPEERQRFFETQHPDSSFYSTVSLAWGLGETAEKTMQLMAKDILLNDSPDRAYCLHTCFLGTYEDMENMETKEAKDAYMRTQLDQFVSRELKFIPMGVFNPLSKEGNVNFYPSKLTFAPLNFESLKFNHGGVPM